MSASPLVIITTRLPPLTCGIGAYSWRVRQHWPNDSSRTRFLVVEGASESRALLGCDAIVAFDGDPKKLGKALDRAGAADLFLHYAGRAYQRFGCPLWLPGVLRNWKGKFPAARLMICFHELPADLALTSPHYWLGLINRRIIRRLAALADVLVTNTEHHAEKLRKISGRRDVHCVPVGSNIEQARDPSPSARARTEFVIFGLPFARWQTLQSFDSLIRRWQASGRLTALHFIGPDDEKFTARANALIDQWPDPRVAIRHGLLPDSEVLRLLQHAQFALTNVTPETWGKSTTFMAFAANGCAVVTHPRYTEAFPLGYTVRVDEVEKISESDLARRTAALKDWYQKNATWAVIANHLAALLGQKERRES
ncbi:MAG TPA: hypothetical protein VGI42_04745 [Chthoniobacterales bacterium]